jgi:integrase
MSHLERCKIINAKETFQANQKRNHPQKGSRIAVEPIRELEQINTIKKLLAEKPRDLLLFTIGINNGLRAGDLLKLRVGQLRGLKIGDTLPIREGKTGKLNIVMVNKSVYKALIKYFEEVDLSDEDFLFKSRKGQNQPITVTNANLIIKSWCRDIGLKGNFGSHTLRKTFGYVQRKKFGVSWEILAKRFNHSHPAITRRYLGIEDAEINGILLNEI